MTVYALIASAGEIIAVYATRAQATTQAFKYNADPWLADDVPDTRAPYQVESWAVLDAA
jgi:hypothetical protein